MRCPFNQKIQCHENWKTGKGKWNYTNILDNCSNCEIYLKTNQTNLEMVNMTKQEKQKWIEERLNRVKETQKALMKERGFDTDIQLMYFEVGETDITVDPTIPLREAKTKYGNREVFKITVTDSDDKYDWMINPASPLFREVLEAMYENKYNFTIVRSGTGKQTRYSIKKAW